MATIKISQLPEATSIDPSDMFIVNTASGTKKANAALVGQIKLSTESKASTEIPASIWSV